MPPEAEYRQQMVFWMAMLISIGMYFVVVRVTPVKGVADNPTLVNILLIVSLGLVAVSFLVKSHFLARARELGKPQFQRAGQILALVFCEAAALFGIVAWFLTGSPRYYWFMLIGAAGMILHYPQRDNTA